MKKINYLTSIFAIVLALGVMSCGDTDEPTPMNPTNGITLADFDGTWQSEITSYQGVDYNADLICQEFSNVVMGEITIDIDAVASTITITDHCKGNHENTFDVTFDPETMIITNTATGGYVRQWEINEYTFNNTDDRFDIGGSVAFVSVIKDTVYKDSNALDTGIPVGVTYALMKD